MNIIGRTVCGIVESSTSGIIKGGRMVGLEIGKKTAEIITYGTMIAVGALLGRYGYKKGKEFVRKGKALVDKEKKEDVDLLEKAKDIMRVGKDRKKQDQSIPES